MTNDGYKIVYFDQYCPTCKHQDKKDEETPCCECLDHPGNLHSNRPVKWEEKK